MNEKIGVALLAAGKGTRLKVSTAKALIPLNGKVLIEHVLDNINDFAKKNNVTLETAVILGHQKEQIENHLKSKNAFQNLAIIHQKQQLGTANAIQNYVEQFSKLDQTIYTLIICTDTPMIKNLHLSRLLNCMRVKRDLLGLAASMELEDADGYGRILRHQNGFQIIEHKDATFDQRSIKEVNSGLYLVRTDFLKEKIFNIDNKNAAGEFYLTDLFQPETKVEALKFEDHESFQGINDLKQLHDIGKFMQERINQEHLNNGVLIQDSTSTFIESSVEISANVIIEANVFLKGRTKISDGVYISAGSYIVDSTIETGSKILPYSVIEKARIGKNCVLGPFARIRPDSDLADDVKIGNFVEIKKTKLEQSVKVSHLSYVGDAEIGENTNIGCGFVTCNYDGAQKHKTIIGKNTFVGSDCQTIAPVNIGNEAYIGSGSTINKDVPDGAFAIARSRQETKLEMAKRFIKSKDFPDRS